MKQAPYGEEGVDLSCDWVIGLALNGPKRGHFGVSLGLHRHFQLGRGKTVKPPNHSAMRLQQVLLVAGLHKQEALQLNDERGDNTIESPYFCLNNSAHKPSIRL